MRAVGETASAEGLHLTRGHMEWSSAAIGVDVERHGNTTGRAVLLVPGLGASPIAFSLNPATSLLSTLVAAHHEVWTADFRFSWRGRGQTWLSLLDALEGVTGQLAQRCGAPVDVVGHSLGGMLGLALAVRGAPVRRVVTLGSALDFRLGPSPLPRLLSLSPRGLPAFPARTLRGGVPLERLARWGGPLFGRGLRLPIERDQFCGDATPPEVVRQVVQHGVRDLPLPLLLDLAGLFSERGLNVHAHGDILRRAVRHLQTPCLLVAARQDRQCPARAVAALAESLPDARLLEVGTATGVEGGYGHLDLLTAQSAGADVFAPIVRFLSEEQVDGGH